MEDQHDYSSPGLLLSPGSPQMRGRGSSEFQGSRLPSHPALTERCPSKHSFLLSLNKQIQGTQLLKSELNTSSPPKYGAESSENFRGF